MVCGKDHLYELRAIAAMTRQAPDFRAQAIRDAIAAGHSRKEIAEALGVTRQALSQYLERRTK